MLGLLFFVILIHVLVDKCNNYWSDEISESVDVEIQEIEEQRSIVDFYAVVNYFSLISFIYFVRFSLQNHLLSPRMSLLFKDSEIVLELMIAIPNYYFKNPLLRNYILKKVLKRSTVHPENNQIELQSI